MGAGKCGSNVRADVRARAVMPEKLGGEFRLQDKVKTRGGWNGKTR